MKRPGLQVRSLDGYVAPRGRPQQLRRPPALLPAVWDAVASAITTSGVPIRVFAAPFKGRDKNAMVAITLEIGASKLDLVERDGAYRGVFEIVFALTDSKNKKWPLMRHRAEVAFKPPDVRAGQPERVAGGVAAAAAEGTLSAARVGRRCGAGRKRGVRPGSARSPGRPLDERHRIHLGRGAGDVHRQPVHPDRRAFRGHRPRCARSRAKTP